MDALVFDQVARINHVSLTDPDSPVEEGVLRGIYKSVKLPATVDDSEFLEWASRGGRLGGIHLNRDLITSDPNHDPYDLGHLKYWLCLLWQSLSFAVRNGGSEFDVHSAIHPLLRWAFHSDFRKYPTAVIVCYETEQELCLPKPPGIVKADAIVWSPLSFDFANYLKGSHGWHNHVFSAQPGWMERGDFVTFAFEARVRDEDASRQQLALDLCSAQNQRRALGFDNDIIYGAVLVGSYFTLYTSQWKDDIVVVQPTDTVFNVTHLHDFLSLFLFLSRLAEDLADRVERMSGEWQRNRTTIMQKTKEATRNPWRILPNILEISDQDDSDEDQTGTSLGGESVTGSDSEGTDDSQELPLGGRYVRN